MRELELGARHLEIVEEEQIDVEETWAESGRPSPTGGELESLGQAEELPGAQLGFGQQSGVEKRRLGNGGDRTGTEERGDAQDSEVLLQSLDRGVKSGLWIAQIATQSQRYPVFGVLWSGRRPGR